MAQVREISVSPLSVVKNVSEKLQMCIYLMCLGRELVKRRQLHIHCIQGCIEGEGAPLEFLQNFVFMIMVIAPLHFCNPEFVPPSLNLCMPPWCW